MNRVKSVVATALFVVMSGCSLIKSRGPGPNYEPQQPPRCAVTRAYPVTDTVLGGVSLLGAVGTGITAANAGNQNTSTGTVISALAASALAVLFGVSAYVGFSNSSACEEALAQNEAFRRNLIESARIAQENDRAQRFAEVDAAKSLPLTPIVIRVFNDHAESLVTLSIRHPESEEIVSSMTARRMSAGERMELRADVHTGLVLEVTGSMMTLGLEHNLGMVRVPPPPSPSGVFVVRVDFDVALGRHRAIAYWVQ